MSDSDEETDFRSKKPRYSQSINSEPCSPSNQSGPSSSWIKTEPCSQSMITEPSNQSEPCSQSDISEPCSQSIKIEPYDSLEIFDYSIIDETVIDDVPNKTSTSTVIKKIVDLPKDCLVKIMDHLDFVDLMNVANATTKLCEAACELYGQQYADKLVSYNGDICSERVMEVDVTEITIEINDSRSCLKVLRAFGKVITKLKLNFQKIDESRKEVWTQAISQVLNEYCNKSLKELEWYVCPKEAMEKATKEFTKLKSLRIVSGYLSEKMTSFVYFFPNLERLELVGVEVANRKCIERTFKRVTHMKLNIETRKGMDFLKSNVKAALELNPQLTSFSVGAGCDVKLLSYINEKLPRLEALEIQNPRKKFFDSLENRVYFDWVKNLSLDITDTKDLFTNIPFRFQRLKRLNLNISCRHQDEWIDFVTLNPKLVQLNLLHFTWFYVMKEEQLLRIAKALPKLHTFLLDWRVPSLEVVAKFVKGCLRLAKMRLSIRTRPERAAIDAQFGDGWQTDINEQFMTLQRNED